MRTIYTKRRGCGYRKSGCVYLISEPGDGELPTWVDIDPPIEFEGEHFRGCIYVDLEAILEGKPIDEYLAGASAERNRKRIAANPELHAFGMAYRKRLSVGICINDGLDALSSLEMQNVRAFGLSMRRLGKTVNNKALVEVAQIWAQAQNSRWDLVLASLWRLHSKLSPKQVTDVIVLSCIRSAMISINARADAEEIK